MSAKCLMSNWSVEIIVRGLIHKKLDNRILRLRFSSILFTLPTLSQL